MDAEERCPPLIGHSLIPRQMELDGTNEIDNQKEREEGMEMNWHE